MRKKSWWLQYENGLESLTDSIKAKQLGGSVLHSRLKDDINLDLDRTGKVGVEQK